MTKELKISPKLNEENVLLSFRPIDGKDTIQIMPISEPKFILLSKDNEDAEEGQWFVEASCEDNDLLNKKGFVFEEDFQE
jgi:hypothetical protein